MVRIVIFCSNPEESRLVKELLASLLWERQEKPLFQEFVNDRPGFLKYVKGNPYLIMLVAQSGAEGAETARLAKEANSRARLVWFSDQNYALYAYGLHITHFALFPISREKLENVIDACRIPRLPQDSAMSV